MLSISGSPWQYFSSEPPPFAQVLKGVKRCADLSFAEVEVLEREYAKNPVVSAGYVWSTYFQPSFVSLAGRIVDYHTRFEQGNSLTPQEGEALVLELGQHLPSLQKSLRGIIATAEAESKSPAWNLKKIELLQKMEEGKADYYVYLNALAPFIKSMPESLYAREFMLPLLNFGGIRPGVKIGYPAEGVSEKILESMKRVNDNQFTLDLTRTDQWTLNKKVIYRQEDHNSNEVQKNISQLVNENGWVRVQQFANQMLGSYILEQVMADPKAVVLPITQCTRDITVDVKDKGEELQFRYRMAQRFTAVEYHPRSFAGGFLASCTLIFQKSELNKPLSEPLDPEKLVTKLTCSPLRFVIN